MLWQNSRESMLFAGKDILSIGVGNSKKVVTICPDAQR